jgi:hypothetical protein
VANKTIIDDSVSCSAGTALFEGELQVKERKSSSNPDSGNSTENKAPEIDETVQQQPEKKNKKKKIIKKIKKVKKSKISEEINVNASNNTVPLTYELVSFIARTGGTGALPHFCYFKRESSDSWLVFDDGNYALCTAAEVAKSKASAVIVLYNKV